MKRIAVAIVHGVEIDDPQFAVTPTRLLHEGFARAVGRDGPDPEDALTIEPINWAPQLQSRQQELFGRMFPEGGDPYFDAGLTGAIRRINAGSVLSMIPFLMSLLRATVPPLRSLHYPTGRWTMVHFVGDAIAYDRGASPANYVAIHAAFARGLDALAARAGEDAPLCVIAHSFGTVLASDYFYDQQQDRTGRPDLVAPEVRNAAGSAHLVRGDTLGWFYTMGSPIALWSLRYPGAELTRPIAVPAPWLAEHHPEASGEWINFYEPDDVFAYPLRNLSDGYRTAVREDRAVSLKTFPISVTPLVHPFYWSERSVMDGIARTLAGAWRRLNA